MPGTTLAQANVGVTELANASPTWLSARPEPDADDSRLGAAHRSLRHPEVRTAGPAPSGGGHRNATCRGAGGNGGADLVVGVDGECRGGSVERHRARPSECASSDDDGGTDRSR